MGILRNRSGNKRLTVRPSEQTDLTPYDPIRNDPGYNDTNVHNAAVPLASRLRKGTVVRARDAQPPRKAAEKGVALPRHDYTNR